MNDQRNEYYTQKHMLLEWTAIAVAERKIQREIVEKRQVGRPKKNTMLICQNTIKQEEEEQDARRKKSQHL